MNFYNSFKNIFKPKVDLPRLKPINPNFINNESIPEVVMDKDLIVYNYGYDEIKKTYKVLIVPYKNVVAFASKM